MILITGGNGVLGSAFKALNKKKFYFINSRNEINLKSYHDVKKFFNNKQFEGIIHLAAVSGGLGLSGPQYQATLLRDNLIMLFNILDIAAEKKIKKILLTLSSGMYSPTSKMPHQEKDLHSGPPHESSYGYFYAKRMFEPALRAYRDQFKMNIIGCVPNGIFGENDNFSDHAPMLPSIIKRMYKAKIENQNIVIWGDGSPLREYTYSKDMAKALYYCYKNYSSSQIINVGSNEERSIKKIAFLIADALDFDKKKILFDTSKPLGV